MHNPLNWPLSVLEQRGTSDNQSLGQDKDISQSKPWICLHPCVHKQLGVIDKQEARNILIYWHTPAFVCQYCLSAHLSPPTVSLLFSVLSKKSLLVLDGWLCPRLSMRCLDVWFVCVWLWPYAGVEQLSSLQHLDLAYNLLLDHSQLAPLSMLHSLNMVK